jgi:hypothetical protein
MIIEKAAKKVREADFSIPTVRCKRLAFAHDAGYLLHSSWVHYAQSYNQRQKSVWARMA